MPWMIKLAITATSDRVRSYIDNEPINRGYLIGI